MNKVTPTEVAGAKHRYDDLYDSESPIPYCQAMLEVSYRQDDYFKSSLVELSSFIRDMNLGDRVRILDVCSGYGINALYLRTGIEGASIFQTLAKADFCISDRVQGVLPTRTVNIIGLDIALPALRFAERTGLHDASISTNLEMADISAEQSKLIKNLDVLISTGSSSYITHKTFERVLGGG